VTARYQFLPWVRQGAATAYREPDRLQPVLSLPGGKPPTAFPVALKINDRTPVDVPLRLYGPGDVTGLDPRAVIRTDPLPNTADFEPNFLASIEFDTPDLPWLFTPAAAGTNGRLRPWLCLVVVERGENVSLHGRPGLPPTLIAPASQLPDLAESWAWAHAQALQPDESQPVAEILGSRPAQNLSRLICPRRLEPSTRYIACVVPAFAAGRKAGLGEEVTEDDQNRLAPAWVGTEPQVQLPAYFVWEFATGVGGDFESLAARLQGRPVAADVGRRPLRVEDQPFGLPDVGVLAFMGALVSTEAAAPPPAPPAFRLALRAVLNPSPADPVVTPPVYGSRQASQPTVPAQGEPPAWFGELNLDPAARAGAGLGVRVVQQRQEQLVASAWEQLGDPTGVAGLELRLEVAISVADSVVRRRVQAMPPGKLVQFLGPAQTRMRASAETLRASLARQGLPASFSSAPFRRTVRPAGSLARRRGGAGAPEFQRLATSLGRVVPPIGPAAGTRGLVTPVIVSGQMSRLPPGAIGALLRYRQSVSAVQAYVNAFAGRPRPVPSVLQLTPALKANIVASVDPRETVPRRFFARVASAAGAAPAPPAPGRSVVTGPTFPQPMYEALRDLSPEFLLPGVGSILTDTVTLLNSNPRFIEAYMVGLNHELSAELLWREFPGDLRGTAFHRFWDTRGASETIAQLPAIRSWNPAAALGSNFAGGEQLVLLIRGELLQRYPDALIYAVKARTLSTLGTEEQLPLFRGRIEPDITFLGFKLTDEEARGGATSRGWFFVIQEQPTAPRFGLDVTREKPLVSWNDLGWSDLKTAPGAHLRTDDLLVPAADRPPGPVWPLNGAHLAAILRQRPVRVAFHARRLLPPPPPQPPSPR
jgi:hypothetical protein